MMRGLVCLKDSGSYTGMGLKPLPGLTKQGRSQRRDKTEHLVSHAGHGANNPHP